MIRIVHVRSRWIKWFLAALLGLFLWMLWRVERPGPSRPPTVAGERTAEADTVWAQAETLHGPISLNRAVVCLDVHEGRPLLIKSAYDRRVDYLYCYSVLTAPKGPVTVFHRWIENGIVVFEKKMIVHGNKIRVWSRRQMYRKQSGDWRVEIVSEGGVVLGHVLFKIW